MQLKSNSPPDKRVYILDNGAYTAKVGPASMDSPKIMPNCVMKVKSERRRPFIGDQIEECRDVSGLFYMLPLQRGFIVNWDTQKTVWDYIFSRDCLNAKLNDCTLILTEPLFNFRSIQEATNEIFFEDYECNALLRVNATDLSAYNFFQMTGSCDCIVIDSGYSFTHIVPYINGRKLHSAVRRIDVGGKVLTNHMKEVISYRQLHVMDETYVINQAKEDCCFVSQNFCRDMRLAALKSDKSIAREYVLPDYSKIRRGYMLDPNPNPDLDQHCAPSPPNGLAVKPKMNGVLNGYHHHDHHHHHHNNHSNHHHRDEKLRAESAQTLRLCNERIAVPEVLFSPSDIGVPQMGISEAVIDCLQACPEKKRNSLVANVVVTGGNAMLRGFKERIQADIRNMCPDLWDVSVHRPDHPIAYSWQGGKLLANDPCLKKMCVSRSAYEEIGHNISFGWFD